MGHNTVSDALSLSKPGGMVVTQPNPINLEEPISSGYPAQTGLICSSIRDSVRE